MRKTAIITIRNLQKQVPLNPRQITKTVRKILRFLRIVEADLSFVFVTDKAITALNKRYLRRTYATDVLAFDLRQEFPSKRGSFHRKFLSPLTAEIVISTQTAVRNAHRFNMPVSQAIALYMAHGLLHLLGFDDHSASAAQRMHNKEIEILKYLTKNLPR